MEKKDKKMRKEEAQILELSEAAGPVKRSTVKRKGGPL